MNENQKIDNRIKNIDLIDEYYVQKLNKDFALVKIKFLGKIDKIINKCLKNAILIVDNYGFLKKDDQTMYDEYLKANQKLYSYVSPSLAT